MEILIQNKNTKQYLSTFGLWVDAIADAKDFMAILPAYNFAQLFTSDPFEVVIHFPDDEHVSPVIDGMGHAPSIAPDLSAPIDTTATLLSSRTESTPYWQPTSRRAYRTEVIELEAA